MEWRNNWRYDGRRSSGVAKGGLATGIVGSVLGTMALLGSGANAFGRVVDNAGCNNGFGYGMVPQTVVVNANDDFNRNGRNGEGCCSENMLVNRYELNLQQQLAEKDSQIALRDANTYGDQKMLEMYKYIDGELKDIRRNLAAQAVVNQKTEDSFTLAQKDLQCCCDKLAIQIDRERDERKCADNTIITYTNATFYPKMVADVTVGTTTTAQSTYNPLPCTNSCNCGNR